MESMKVKTVFTVSLLFLAAVPSSWADVLFLKSGETLRGRVTEKNDASYTFVPEGQEEPVDVAFTRVSIADIDPTSAVGSKPSVILYSQSGTPSKSKGSLNIINEEEGVISSPGSTNSVVAIDSRVGLLKKAEATVAQSNARTAEIEKRLMEIKDIADQANGISPADSPTTDSPASD